MVRDWHRAFQATVNHEPTIPSSADAMLRISLHSEEAVTEMSRAFASKDVVEIADSIADALFVIYGTAVTCGIDAELAFAEVFRSNMSKLWTLNELTPEQIPKGCGVTSVVNVNPETERDVRAFVVKRPDGKVVKAPGFSPVNPDKFFA